MTIYRCIDILSHHPALLSSLLIKLRLLALEHGTLTCLSGLSESAGVGGSERVFVGSVFTRFASQTAEKPSARGAGGAGGPGAEQSSAGRRLSGENGGELESEPVL